MYGPKRTGHPDYRTLHLFKRTMLDLSDSRARHAKLNREVLERLWIFRKVTGLENAPLALVQDRKFHCQGILSGIELFGVDETLFLIGRVIDELILPFGRLRLVS
jgi:hypothetical protein